MRKFLKFLLILVLIIVLVVSAIASYVYFALPNVGAAPQITIKQTPERIDRGSYLVNSVAACMVCHAKRDYRFYAGPVDSASFGAGGDKFSREMGFPGDLYPGNLTPYGLGAWSDGELYRTLTTGVNKNGKALFPVMPYQHYAQMDKEDIYSIIAYLRTLKSIKNDLPERELDFPLNFIVNTIPAKAVEATRPAADNTVEYGKYLVNIASCSECHSMAVKGKVIEDSAFSGGREFKLRYGTLRSFNITPDTATGIGSWSREFFIQRFKMHADSSWRNKPVAPGDFNTTMPWITYGSMTEQDLGAIYDYLRTVKPVHHKVEKFSKAK